MTEQRAAISDAYGSALLGAVATVAAVLIAQWFINRNRRADLREAARLRADDLNRFEAERKHDVAAALTRDRRRLADDLILAVSNLRDMAVYSRRAAEGKFAMYELRNPLLRARWALDGLPSYSNVWEFYTATLHLREWLRSRRSVGSSDNLDRTEAEAYGQFKERLRAYAIEVIEDLQLRLEDSETVIRNWCEDDFPSLPGATFRRSTAAPYQPEDDQPEST